MKEKIVLLMLSEAVLNIQNELCVTTPCVSTTSHCSCLCLGEITLRFTGKEKEKIKKEHITQRDQVLLREISISLCI